MKPREVIDFTVPVPVNGSFRPKVFFTIYMYYTVVYVLDSVNGILG